MTYRVAISRPGAVTPHTICYAKEAGFYSEASFLDQQPTQRDIVPLGGSFEILRGDFPGTGNLILSAPPTQLKPRDRVQIWLPGDPHNKPTYVGLVASDRWFDGQGEIVLAPLTTQVAKAMWQGSIRRSFKDFLTFALDQAVLPPGITIGSIPDPAVILKAKTDFELIGDLMASAMPAIDGGTWGVRSDLTVAVYEPTQQVTRRFVLGEAETPVGSAENYANCVRFTYTLPNGQQDRFIGRNEAEIVANGEEWETTEVPARVDTIGEILNHTTYPTLAVTVAGTVPPLIAARNADASSTFVTASLPVLNTGWTGNLAQAADGTSFNLSTGPTALLARPPANSNILADYDIHIAVPGWYPQVKPFWPGRNDYDLAGTERFRIYLYAEPGVKMNIIGNVTDSYPNSVNSITVPSGGVSTWVNWQADSDFYITYDSAEAEAFISSNNKPPRPIRFAVRGSLSTGATEDTMVAFSDYGNYPLSVEGAAPLQNSSIPTRLEGLVYKTYFLEDPYILKNRTTSTVIPADFDTNADHLFGAVISATLGNEARLALPSQITLLRGSVLITNDKVTQMRIPNLSNGTFTVLTGETVVDEFSAGTTKLWGVPDNMLVSQFWVKGDLTKIGTMLIQLSDLSGLTLFAQGLLRYRSDVQRAWRGDVREFKNIPAVGVCLYETPLGDVQLDLQRINYDLSSLSVSIESGTPMSRTDEDAIPDAFETIRREIRQGAS